MKVLSLIAALVMPLCLIGMGTMDSFVEVVNPYYLLFCGFYGCVFLCLSWERKWLWLKILLCVVNAAINGFIILAAFVSSALGPLWALLMMIIPLPWYEIFG